MRESSSTILSSLDTDVGGFGDVLYKQDEGGVVVIRTSNEDRVLGYVSLKRKRSFPALDELLKIFRLIANPVYRTVYDHLGCIHASVPHDTRVVTLSSIELRFTECVLPSKVIPVRHFVSEDQKVRILGEGDDIGVRGRARGTTLALKELNDREMGGMG